jgi:hypothetical protein
MTLTRARVLEPLDPTGEGRLQVTVPSAGVTGWADRVHPLAAFGGADVEQDAEVWVAFEDDDLARPVVLGLVHAPTRGAALARDREAMGDAWDRGHAAGSGDEASGSDTANPYR